MIMKSNILELLPVKAIVTEKVVDRKESESRIAEMIIGATLELMVFVAKKKLS